MDHLGAFTYNGIRFILGALSLLPLLFFSLYKKEVPTEKIFSKKVLLSGFIVGSCLFIAASLQQVGLITTTAGKAAFITGLYIVFVPFLGIFIKQKVHTHTWVGTFFAVLGLYALCISEDFSIATGDLLELGSAFFFAIHILLIDHFSTKVHTLVLAFLQFLFCGLFSLIVGLTFEPFVWSRIIGAFIPIVYGGICSVGIAYTLQIVAQKKVKPSHAAMIMSMEAVFATIGGVLFLQERLGVKELIGCLLMLSGMILCQIKPKQKAA
jgi:drug/metabolite transporter (DMT)-like permease